ncbi:MAG: carbohydrate ABC transporter permease [Chloroflexi bacterium]|uniref:carbohydrate ABC transporter permease n=1 Tax=Candidatus Flexifilum breve TaxID=3140694 RepID=UPI0031369F5A|nr:carbohydrate ABC transporter permease [Chloroflexota bacterium]MBK9747944.1 carbohydrate ABC transporter permease [Chloroflexota bacterium]
MTASNAALNAPLNFRSVTTRKTITKGWWFLLACVVTAAFSLPLYWLVITALKSDVEVFRNPPTWFPSVVMWQNFPDAVAEIPFVKYVTNSMIYATLSCLGAAFSSTLVAYGFSKVQWRGRNLVFGLVLATMFLPGQVTMIPTYMVWRTLNLTGTMWPLIIPSFLGNAYYIFLMRQFMRTVPDELIDAARIDGCSEFGVLRRIMLPLIRPALVFVVLQQFLGAWKDFFGPLIYLQRQDQFTLSLGLQQFQSAHNTDYALLMACSALFTIPLLVLFFFGQRYFIEGVTLTGLKG